MQLDTVLVDDLSCAAAMLPLTHRPIDISLVRIKAKKPRWKRLGFLFINYSRTYPTMLVLPHNRGNASEAKSGILLCVS